MNHRAQPKSGGHVALLAQSAWNRRRATVRWRSLDGQIKKRRMLEAIRRNRLTNVIDQLFKKEWPAAKAALRKIPYDESRVEYEPDGRRRRR